MPTRTTTATAWDAAVATGLLRLGVGAALLRWRRPLSRLAGAADDDGVARLAFGYFGVRDMTLGISALAASRPGADVCRQVVLQGVADTVDAAIVAALTAAGRFPRMRGVGMAGLAVASAAVEYGGAWRLRRATVSS